ncbi:MAG: glycoside hydrolase family 27 protein, partial [Asticcacaulis sp.]
MKSVFAGLAASALLLVQGLAGSAVAHESLKLEAPKPDLASVPPMGWNSWNKYKCDISEALIRKQADAMASSG